MTGLPRRPRQARTAVSRPSRPRRPARPASRASRASAFPPPSVNPALPSDDVDRLAVAELVDLGLEVHGGVLPVHPQAPEARARDAPAHGRLAVVSLLVAADRAGPAAVGLTEDIQRCA